MTYKFLGIGALIGLVLGGGGYAYAAHQVNAHAAAYAVLTPVSSTSPATYHVALLGTHAEPAELLVHVGDVIYFDTKDGQSHVIAQGVGNGDGEHHSHEAGAPESGTFGPGEAFKVVIKKPGAYFFHDHEHPDIHVSVAAYDPNLKSSR